MPVQWRGGSGAGAIGLSVLGLLASSLWVVLGLPHASPSNDADSSGAGPYLALLSDPPASPSSPSSSGDFSAVVSSDSSLGEVGVANSFAATIFGGQPPYNVTWSDPQGDSGWGSTWAVVPQTPGNLSVTAEVRDGLDGRAAASYRLPVAGNIAIAFPTPVNATDPGLPIDVPVVITGGVQPFTIVFALPAESPETVVLAHAGRCDLLVTPASDGPAYLSVNVTDWWGVSARAVALVATVARVLDLHWDFAPSTVDAGQSLTVRADADGGTAPLNWSVVAAGPLAPDARSSGSLGSPGVIVWVGTFTAPGNATLALYVTDVRGLTVSSRLVIDVRAPMALIGPSAEPSIVLGAEIMLNVTLVGGTPPYNFEGTASDGETITGELDQPGNFSWTLAPTALGALSISVRATDGAGSIRTSNWTTEVAGPPRTPTPSLPASDPSPLPAIVGAAVLAGAGAVGLVIWWRRRPRSTTPGDRPPIDLSDVQRMLADEEGLERETLYLLGEEQGLLRSTVAAQIKEGLRTGRIAVERAVTGEEVFRWADHPADDRPPEVHA